jgi:protein SCO1/2
MPTKNNRVVITIIGLLAFIALIFGLFTAQQVQYKGVNTSQFHGTYLKKPRAVRSFSLTGVDKMPFNNTSLKGHWTMLFFGFTRCGSICPTTMTELGKMYRLLQRKGTKKLPQVVMVSVDPDRDSGDQLNQYVKAFDPHFYGAWGDEEVINAMTKEMGIAYAKIAISGDEDPQHYDIEHTGTVLLFNPKGQLSAFFTMPHYASSLAKDYLLLAS